MKVYSVLLPLLLFQNVPVVAGQQFIVRESVAQATILVHLGRFSSAQTASEAADRIGSTQEWFAADPSDRAAATEGFAALELRHHLCRMAGLDETDPQVLPIVDSSRDVSGTVIQLGSPLENRRARDAYGALDPGKVAVEAGDSPDGFYIYSYADPGGGIILIRGNGPIGTLYGTYAFLDSLGVRWFSPSERDTIVPRQTTIRVGSLDWGEHPAMGYRQLYADIRNKELYFWMARNRLNGYAGGGASQGFRRKLGMMSAVGQHGFFTDLVSPERHYAAHPEWFGMAENGKRNLPDDQPVYNVNYCTSNSALIRELQKDLIIALDSGKWKDADIVEIWGFDAGKWCACSECRKLGTPTDRLLNLVYQMGQALAEARRERRLTRPVKTFLLSYQETVQPPTRPLPEDFDRASTAVTFFPIRRCYFHRFNDPDCAELNLYYDTSLRSWTSPHAHYRGKVIIGEYYNLSGFREFPVIFKNSMGNDIPYFAERGVAGMNYMLCPAGAWGHRALTNYQFARQMWNPRSDLRGLWNDYFQNYYGPAAKVMQEYYTALEQAMSNATAWRYDLWQKLHVVNRHPEVPLFPIGNIPPISWYGKKNFPGSKEAGQDIFLGFPERSVISDHLRFEEFHPPRNDAPDWIEIMASLENARRIMNQALQAETPATVKTRISEDEHLFRYGELALHLYDHVIRMILAKDQDQQKAELRAGRSYAEKLRNYTFGGPAPDGETNNGLLGVGLEPILKEYGRRLQLE